MMPVPSTLRRNQGFTLLEMTIVIAIMAILVTGGLVVATGQLEPGRIRKTNETLKRIEEGLQLHVEMFNDLPCPAQGELPFASPGFGQENCGTVNFTSSRTMIGIVPVRSINLPDDYALDGWGRRITYAVDQEYTNGVWHPDLVDAPNQTRAQGEIVVTDLNGSLRTTRVRLNDVPIGAVYVLVSHGKNGLGAWSVSGNTRIATSTPNSFENANAHLVGSHDITFIDDRLRTGGAESSYYDDVVRWKVKNQLKRPVSE